MSRIFGRQAMPSVQVDERTVFTMQYSVYCRPFLTQQKGRKMSQQDDFIRVFTWVLGGLVLFTIIVFLLARAVGLEEHSGYMTEEDIRERIKPYGGSVVTASPEAKAEEAAKPAAKPAEKPQASQQAAAQPAQMPAAAAPAAAPQAAAIDAQKLYMQACQACHISGAAGAPKLGDKAAWAPRIAAGTDALVKSAIMGKGAMPPKGGRLDFSNEQISAIVSYMVSQSQ
jgi:cytochrome c5